MVSKIIKTTLRGLLWCVIAGLTLECCARLDDWISYGASPFGLYDNSLLGAFDQLGQHGRPYGQYLKWKLNSLGFRGPELDPTATRILCVGSSETFGQFETAGHEWPRELELLLNERVAAGHYQLVNTGFAGETFPTSIRRLPSRLAIVKPKVVLFYPSLAHYLSLPELRKAPPPPVQPRFRWRMKGRLETTVKQVMPMWMQTWLRQREIARSKGSGPQFANMPVEYQNEFRKNLEQAIDLSRTAGAEPVLITHSNRFKDRIAPDERFMLVAWQKFYPTLRDDSFLRMEDTMNNLMRDVAESKGVLLIDAARAMPAGPAYFGDFVHFTDRGSAAFSQIVAQKLISEFTTQARVLPPTR